MRPDPSGRGAGGEWRPPAALSGLKSPPTVKASNLSRGHPGGQVARTKGSAPMGGAVLSSQAGPAAGLRGWGPRRRCDLRLRGLPCDKPPDPPCCAIHSLFVPLSFQKPVKTALAPSRPASGPCPLRKCKQEASFGNLLRQGGRLLGRRSSGNGGGLLLK